MSTLEHGAPQQEDLQRIVIRAVHRAAEDSAPSRKDWAVKVTLVVVWTIVIPATVFVIELLDRGPSPMDVSPAHFAALATPFAAAFSLSGLFLVRHMRGAASRTIRLRQIEARLRSEYEAR